MYSIVAKKNILYIIYKMYVTLRLDDNRCCRIHSVSDDGNGWIVTDEAPGKFVTGDPDLKR